MALENCLARLADTVQQLNQLDFEYPKADLRSLGIGPPAGGHQEGQTPPVSMRPPRPFEHKLSTAEFDKLLEEVQVKSNELKFRNKKTLSAFEFEDLFERTVDLAELCAIPECDERLDDIAVQYESLAESSEVLRNQLNEIQLTLPDPESDRNDGNRLMEELNQIQNDIRQTRALVMKKERILGELDQQITKHRRVATVKATSQSMSSSDSYEMAEIGHLEKLVAEKSRFLKAQEEAYGGSPEKAPGASPPGFDWALLEPVVAFDSTVQEQIRAYRDAPDRMAWQSSGAARGEKIPSHLGSVQAILNRILVTTENYHYNADFIQAALQRTTALVAEARPLATTGSRPTNASPNGAPEFPIETVLAAAALHHLIESGGVVLFRDLKVHTGKAAEARGYPVEKAVESIYSMVAKKWIEIDRTTKDTLVRFKDSMA
ncbi:hypothetical protein H4R33_001719 [Dimargaris cristalligena]|uniref:Uncharacterized protein n=1 Tax=Dimargaris cristalligena TaxID=215637 RepID=A0A4P9ZM53_9FUNG|nr:hypothetical protein H4R33_001719 [Dimargaris cristalligena]RKP34253.1 hypothetical protein BJ085DRAFT_39355 [Dimargaris cristalligena]|eukprot:RKP34253.1 hypothetical protein BJ085DRAFT_39355 [Dimargaris cristalligena]